MIFYVLHFLLILTLSLRCKCYCPSPYIAYNESSCFYMYYSQIMTVNFKKAEKQCASKFEKFTGQLASFDNIDQERWAVENLLSSKMLTQQTHASIWIGLKRNSSHFDWLDGNPSEYRHWEPDEPNNSNYSGGTEDCVQIRYHSQRNQGWNDLSCADRIDGYICRTKYIKDVNNSMTSQAETATKKATTSNYPAIVGGLSCAAVVLFVVLVGFFYRRYKFRNVQRFPNHVTFENNNID